MNSPTPSAGRLRALQARVFWLLWGGYAAYYLCRLNFAVAQPELLKEFPTWTNAQIGTIPSVYALTYAIGQIFNGMLGQRYGTRKMMGLAMLGVGVTNVAFSYANSFETMRLLWAVNGWFQSAGWSLMVGTLADWHPATRRGTLIGRLATCYTVGNVAAWLLAGYLCDAVGWRASFWVPGLLMFPAAVVFFLLMRDAPEQAGLPPMREELAAERAANSSGHGDAAAVNWSATWQACRHTLASRALWILTVSFLVMNAVRYSFMNWTVQYMADFHGRSIKNSALSAVVVPLVGSLGALSAGWVSDVCFGRRRAPVCVLMMAGLALACGAMAFVPRGHWLLATALLALVGFMIYGPDMLVSGVATVDLSHPRASAIATGMTMCAGALGAIFSGAGVGWLKDFSQGDWSTVFWVLAALPLLPALLLATLWNARPKTGG